jgi:hypothetical protein
VEIMGRKGKMSETLLGGDAWEGAGARVRSQRACKGPVSFMKR